MLAILRYPSLKGLCIGELNRMNSNFDCFFNCRLFFASMIIFVVLVVTSFITQVWYKWLTQPMIITVSPNATSIGDIPFPSVTICNMNRVQRSAIENLTVSSREYAIAHTMCMNTLDDEVLISETSSWPDFKKVLLKVIETIRLPRI